MLGAYKTSRKRDSMAPVVADMFYNRLFELDPSLRELFETDMEQQGVKLMKMITIAVNGLDNLEAIIPIVQALGEGMLLTE